MKCRIFLIFRPLVPICWMKVHEFNSSESDFIIFIVIQANSELSWSFQKFRSLNLAKTNFANLIVTSMEWTHFSFGMSLYPLVMIPEPTKVQINLYLLHVLLYIFWKYYVFSHLLYNIPTLINVYDFDQERIHILFTSQLLSIYFDQRIWLWSTYLYIVYTHYYVSTLINVFDFDQRIFLLYNANFIHLVGGVK